MSNSLPAALQRLDMMLHTYKWQLKSCLLHIGWVDEQTFTTARSCVVSVSPVPHIELITFLWWRKFLHISPGAKQWYSIVEHVRYCKAWHIVLIAFCMLLLVVKYERIKFLVVALKDGIEIYAWAPKPYHKFMAFKVTLKNLMFCTAWLLTCSVLSVSLLALQKISCNFCTY